MKKVRFLILSVCLLLACGKGGQNSNPASSATENDPSPDNRVPFQWDRKKCSSWTDSVNRNRIEFCIKSTQTITQGKTLYAFHGMGGKPQDICNRVTSSTSSFEEVGSISHVVCPSFGPHWTIHENGRNESFVRFQTYIQRKFGASSEIRPVLYGESMGGFNSIKLSGASNSKGLKFQKVGVSCPAIFSLRLPARSIGSYLPQSVFGSFDRETSLSIIQDSPYFDTSVTYPKLFILANTDDQIGRHTFSVSGMTIHTLGGIYQGAKDFYTAIRQRDVTAQFKKLPGGHCENIPMEDMIAFLGR